ncbi:MazG family protein [Cryobacterium sp. TMT1-21]|uniref:MazG family protein n=2 Tax=Cryobacterium TaxID=69578 RepID=A0AAQ2C599_9MICO|nr:MazG family protein [Cryobacterium sp. TMT2-23]TFC45526.1 MazG family protein [Cryobacterium shii]TFC80924.1 MazG family protein [Cryobacterium sp. TmT2-59]TFD11387.1 MazG family protein [Cryobacterium sp. TMT1-21]TFD18885.1 MazG family protein [Cryobacterium sp. TMT4-10]TFD40690.1 MazG family protein [Cryobacterium sp. TMT2-10]
MPTGPEGASSLDELVRVVAHLRAPGGCPWDGEQTHESLVQYLIEESHELIEAIESGTREELLEELGDVLYQVIFHADLAAHTRGEDFDIQDVAAHMTAKMVGRHPHVFGDATLETAADVSLAWDDFKAAEKPHRTSVLDGIPQGMPALALADKVLGRAQKIGLLGSEAAFPLPMESEDELGPLLLAIVAAAKANGLDSERALRSALRGLQDEIRAAEAESAGAGSGSDVSGSDFSDAGIIGLPAAPD